MLLKFVDSGYARDELVAAKEKALLIDRETVLRNANLDDLKSQAGNDALTYVIYHDTFELRFIVVQELTMLSSPSPLVHFVISHYQVIMKKRHR